LETKQGDKMGYDSAELRRLLRSYRKANRLTLAALGERINKSKATVWKYENGLLDIDIKTLFELSEALCVSARFLLESSVAAEASAHLGKERVNNGISRYYMYFLDGHSKKIARNFIAAADDGERECTLFYHLNTFEKPQDCRDFYTGRVFVSDPYRNFVFQNTNNSVEKLFIVAKEPFRKCGILKGILTGISYKVFQPISFKVILSEHRIAEDETLANRLKIDKENLTNLRKHHALILSEGYDDFTFKA
jgi:transcriptional regulator with XRE-family HTH domain